jgi:hypothetical protein
MSKPSLSEIEKSFCTIVVDGKARQQFFSGKKSKSKSEAHALDNEAIELYSELIGYGHHDAIDSIYPGCAKLIGEKWDEVVDDYLQKYPPNHWRLNMIASRFPQYVTKHGGTWLEQFPFLAELADYEWLELELMEKDIQIVCTDACTLDSAEAFAKYGPVVNQTLVIRQYAYPIPKIVDHLEADELFVYQADEDKTKVAIYRHPETHFCKFLELSHLAYQVIAQAQMHKSSFKDLLEKAVMPNSGSDAQDAVVKFLELTEKLQDLGLFVGTRKI